jgi:hypothetical protein
VERNQEKDIYSQTIVTCVVVTDETPGDIISCIIIFAGPKNPHLIHLETIYFETSYHEWSKIIKEKFLLLKYKIGNIVSFDL